VTDYPTRAGAPGVQPYRSGPPHAAGTQGYSTGTPTGNRNLTAGGYGTQSREDWLAADVREKTIVDVMAAEYLWRVSVAGENLLLDLTYGTGATTRLTDLRLPFVAFVPGACNLVARKINPEASAFARPTLTAASGGLGVVRQFVAAAGVLDARTRRLTAIGAGTTVTVAGVAFAFAAIGNTLDVVDPTVLTAGSVVAELTL